MASKWNNLFIYMLTISAKPSLWRYRQVHDITNETTISAPTIPSTPDCVFVPGVNEPSIQLHLFSNIRVHLCQSPTTGLILHRNPVRLCHSDDTAGFPPHKTANSIVQTTVSAMVTFIRPPFAYLRHIPHIGQCVLPQICDAAPPTKSQQHRPNHRWCHIPHIGQCVLQRVTGNIFTQTTQGIGLLHRYPGHWSTSTT